MRCSYCNNKATFMIRFKRKLGSGFGKIFGCKVHDKIMLDVNNSNYEFEIIEGHKLKMYELML